MPTTDGRVRVVVADHHPFFRDGICSSACARSDQAAAVAEAMRLGLL